MDTQAMMDKITRIVLSKHSQIIEHQQFRLLKQEENEPINTFKARVGYKAAHCEFDTSAAGKDAQPASLTGKRRRSETRFSAA